MTELTKDERMVLEWLSKEDRSTLGECHGSALNGLVDKGMAAIHGAETLGMYRTVSVTDAGHQVLRVTLTSGHRGIR